MKSLGPIERVIVRTSLTLLSPLIRLESRERLGSVDAPVIFTINHNNSFETLVVATIIHLYANCLRTSFLVDWMFGYIPVIGTLVSRVQPVYVYTKKARFQFIEKMKPTADRHDVIEQLVDKLESRNAVALFPEGTRNTDPNKLLKARGGLGKLVLRSDVDVIPIGIDYPKRHQKGIVPSFGFVTIRIGERIRFTEERLLAKDLTRTNAHLKRFLRKKITYRIMSELSRLSGKTYPFDPPVHSEQAGHFSMVS